MQKKIRKKAFNNKVRIFENVGEPWKEILEPKMYNYKNGPYIDLVDSQLGYMDSSIGTFEYFLRRNPQIFIDRSIANQVADMVACFRIECRNGYFHTHNLTNWEIVKKTRDNAIFIYFVLLGSCIIPSKKKEMLQISDRDKFDELCIKIREFRHFNSEFIFEYSDGNRESLVYDFIHNTPEYTEDGEEHYSRLVFYLVKDFSLESYEMISENIEDQIIYLTRENIPKKSLVYIEMEIYVS